MLPERCIKARPSGELARQRLRGFVLLLAQNIRHVICSLLIPPVPVVVHIVAPQVYPDGDVLGFEDALEEPCGIRLLPVALTAADDRLLAAEQLHIGVILREVLHVVHGRVHVHQLVHIIAEAIVGRVDAAEGQTAAEHIRAAQVQVDRMGGTQTAAKGNDTGQSFCSPSPGCTGTSGRGGLTARCCARC